MQIAEVRVEPYRRFPERVHAFVRMGARRWLLSLREGVGRSRPIGRRLFTVSLDDRTTHAAIERAAEQERARKRPSVHAYRD